MTKPWVKVLEKVQLFERAHSPNESNTESSGFKINFTECTLKSASSPFFYVTRPNVILDVDTVDFEDDASLYELTAVIKKREISNVFSAHDNKVTIIDLLQICNDGAGVIFLTETDASSSLPTCRVIRMLPEICTHSFPEASEFIRTRLFSCVDHWMLLVDVPPKSDISYSTVYKDDTDMLYSGRYKKINRLLA